MIVNPEKDCKAITTVGQKLGRALCSCDLLDLLWPRAITCRGDSTQPFTVALHMQDMVLSVSLWTKAVAEYNAQVLPASRGLRN